MPALPTIALPGNYNTRPRVAEVMVANATHQLVRKRETVAELFTHEHVWHTPTKETI
jgi:diaminopimelate decarboxylase